MIKNHNFEFTYNGVAILRFPNGMRFDRENRTDCEDSFQLISPDGSFRLNIEFFRSTKGAKELIEELNTPEEHEIICPPRAIRTAKGVEGYTIVYAIGDGCYEEYTLDLRDETRFNFWLLHKRSTTYDSELYEQVKKEMLENIIKI